MRYTDPTGHVYQPPQVWDLYAGHKSIVSPVLEYYGPHWDYGPDSEPSPQELWYWFDEHPNYDPSTDPVMQDPEHFGVNWFSAASDVANEYTEWRYWFRTEGSFWEKFWGNPTMVEGAAETVIVMGAGAAKAAETIAWGKSFNQGSTVWPASPEEMDALLNIEGVRVPDGSRTGRNKVIWSPSDKIKIVFEQHPYHLDSPDFHRGPHWHMDWPGVIHKRYLPGDLMP